MSNWNEAKVSAEVRRAFEVATVIANEFDDEKVRSAYVLFAALNNQESIITQFFLDMGIALVADVFQILNSREIYEEIFGKEAADTYFDQTVNEETEEEENEPLLKCSDFNLSEDDEIASKVLKVLSGIIEVTADAENFEINDCIIELLYSDKLEMALEDASKTCRAMGLDYIDLNVLLYCILKNKESSAYKFLSFLLKQMQIDIEEFISSIKLGANILDAEASEILPIVVPPSLESCIEVLNNKYEKGEECTILGRDKEIFKAFNIFSKKTKRNAVLVGEPGVGKTAIIEAITQHIVNQTAPKEFYNYTVLSLDVNAMVAGTKYRGEFETKVTILKQFLENTPNIILFVDEMHQMLGAGGTSEGNVDLSGSLKPILSRDDVVFVGATTTNEYNQILSRDGAFKRRFEVIIIKEPKISEVKGMIKAKIKSMEKYHGVRIPSKLVDYIILCSSCFNSDNCNPDKTLDLCDRSMAIAKMKGKKLTSKEDVNKVYEELFEKQIKCDKHTLLCTAYHEIGHYIVTRLTKENEAHKVTAISIIPSADYLGVNVLEKRDTIISIDHEYAEAYIMSLLAGRVAQQRISKRIDSGASSDLEKAKKFAKSVIAEFGMDDDEYKNIYLLDDDLFNEKLAIKIDEKANDLIRKVYDKTEQFVTDHWSEIESMAKYLMKKKIVTSEELECFLQV